MLSREFLKKLGELVDLYNQLQFSGDPDIVNIDEELQEIMGKLQRYLEVKL